MGALPLLKRSFPRKRTTEGLLAEVQQRKSTNLSFSSAGLIEFTASEGMLSTQIETQAMNGIPRHSNAMSWCRKANGGLFLKCTKKSVEGCKPRGNVH